MKLALKSSRQNRRWLVLGGAIVLGIVATGLGPRLAHERPAQLAAQVRAAYRLVSVMAAKKDLAARGPGAGLPYAFGHIDPTVQRQHAVGHYFAIVAARTIAPSNSHRTTTDKTGAAP